MRIEVLLFGPEAAAAERNRLAVELSDDEPTCARLRDAIIAAEPVLVSSLRTARLAVNHRFADDAQRIGPDDEIALIGMVSGG